MNSFSAKEPRVRLDSESYKELHDEVLRRDGWRCQYCGTMSHLEVHHQEFRSHSGPDTAENLITMCAKCHFAIHCARET